MPQQKPQASRATVKNETIKLLNNFRLGCQESAFKARLLIVKPLAVIKANENDIT
jgi:hypothetical protein